ncbi:glycosyltransferase [Clostridium sp.]|uniref:glycosyltransferase n=1 Tax=Clostridium sp. TaxID=1506 RepID=UPI003464AE43
MSCFDLINALKNKHNIILALPKGKNAARYKAKEMNIDTLNQNVMPLIFGYYNGCSNILRVVIKATFTLKYKSKWRKILEQQKPDLVILNSIVQWPMICLLNNMNIKNVCFVRETMRGNSNNIFNQIIAKNLKKAGGLSFLSQYDKNQWSLPKKVKQVVIPDMLDIDNFTYGINRENARKRLKLKSDAFYILYVGGMSKLKGAETIIRAINSCEEKNVKLLFLGDLENDLITSRGFKRIKYYSKISFIKKMNKYIKSYGLIDHIQFVGIQKDMSYWYAACDVVVFPAEEAHQARPIYEAGAFKKPIIASNFDNYHEYLKPGVNGLVFEPKNYIELAQIIEKLYKNPSICNELGKNNYELTIKLHNSSSINLQIQKLIEYVEAE